ncbi:MAG: fatty acid desaturase [Anaerolineales bacterium]|nr:fatty acid desaturase [Anaerolineales bacterium]
MSSRVESRKRSGRPEWFSDLSPYTQADNTHAIWQLINTILPYFALWAVMIYLIREGVSYWLILPLILLAGGFLVRIFIFFHDCCHGSFFESRRINRIVGYFTGILTFTPFEQWRKSHNTHHATVGDLDRRGVGDVWTMTVEEYKAASAIQRFAYRIVRTPFFTFLIGPPLMFFVMQRIPSKGGGKAERNSVWITTGALLAIFALSYFTIGMRTYLLIQLPVMYVAAVAGVWLFYVQHQFEGVYWARHETWEPLRASLQGSSFYRLPAVLQWFSGNIGFHHLHHVSPRIPNYFLPAAYSAVPAVQIDDPLTIRRSLKSLRMNLWDEQNQRLVSFRSLKDASGSG